MPTMTKMIAKASVDQVGIFMSRRSFHATYKDKGATKIRKAIDWVIVT